MIYIQCVEFHVYTLSFYVFYPVVLNLPFVLDIFFFLLDDKIGGALRATLCHPSRCARLACGLASPARVASACGVPWNTPCATFAPATQAGTYGVRPGEACVPVGHPPLWVGLKRTRPYGETAPPEGGRSPDPLLWCLVGRTQVRPPPVRAVPASVPNKYP